MKSAFLWVSSIVLSLILGLATVIFAIAIAAKDSDTKYSGQWYSSTSVGGKDASIYLRAAVAVAGLLAMDKSEATYYSTVTDKDGKPLDGNCTYHLEGKDLAARWWSITAYTKFSYLIDTPEGRHSLSKSSILRKEDGSYLAVISPSKHEGNWISVKQGEKFELKARFYNPTPEVLQSPETVSLPTLTKKTCL